MSPTIIDAKVEAFTSYIIRSIIVCKLLNIPCLGYPYDLNLRLEYHTRNQKLDREHSLQCQPQGYSSRQV